MSQALAISGTGAAEVAPPAARGSFGVANGRKAAGKLRCGLPPADRVVAVLISIKDRRVIAGPGCRRQSDSPSDRARWSMGANRSAGIAWPAKPMRSP